MTHSVGGSLCCATRLTLYSEPTATYTSVPSVGVAAVKNGFTLHRARGGEISTRNWRPTLLRGVALSKSWVSRGKSCSSKVTAYWPLGPSPSYLNVQLDCGGRSKTGGAEKKIRQERTSLQAGSPCAGSPETNGEPASRLSRKKKPPGNYVSITLIIVSSNTYQIIQENWDTVTDKGIDSNFNPRQAPLAINESDARWTFRSLPTGSLFGKAMARAENWGEL